MECWWRSVRREETETVGQLDVGRRVELFEGLE